MPAAFRLAPSQESEGAALVMEPRLSDLLLVLSACHLLGLGAIVAETFLDAKRALTSVRPSVLVTAVRLREYNGLHLVSRARARWPGLPTLVTCDADDPVLHREAQRFGATFVTFPTTPTELAAAIARALLQADDRPVQSPFERRHRDRREGPMSVAADRRTVNRRRPVRTALRPEDA
jgi:DNA-binding NtrC family response regulator